MKTTRFCLVRHGETDWNAALRLQGHTDIPLNTTGMAQARQLAQSLKKSSLQFDALYCSDLARAVKTADAIVAKFRMSAILNPDLRERHLGALQGLTINEAPLSQPHLWQAHLARDLDHEMAGGESINQFAKRIRSALEGLREKHSGQTLLLVSHGGALDMAYRIATNQSLSSGRTVSVPNASLNWISHDGANWKVDQWADTSHLDGLSRENVDL